MNILHELNIPLRHQVMKKIFEPVLKETYFKT